MRLIDADTLKEDLKRYFPNDALKNISAEVLFKQILHDINTSLTIDTQTELTIARSQGYECGFAEGYEEGFAKGKEKPIDDLSEYSDKLWKKAYERGKAEGRKTGHWIKTDNMLNVWKCSECNEEWCSEVGGNPLEYDYHYCPNCGASMLKEAENESEKERL